MKKIAYFVVPIVICLLVGYVSSLVQAQAVAVWYPTLNKPALTPPNAVFPIAWTIIYILMGLSIGFILPIRHRIKPALIGLFIFQLLLTFVWCLVFFNYRNPFLGMIVIVVLLLTIIAYTIAAGRVKPISAILFVPYILWVCFATYLNAYIWMNN